MAYTTQAQIEAYLKTTIAEEQEDLVASLISVVDTMIEQETGRQFYVVTEERDIAVQDGVAWVPDLSNITSIVGYVTQDEDETGDELVIGESYETQPLLEPYTVLFCDNTYRYLKISGDWGYSAEVPAPIVHVATQLASRLFQDSDRSQGVTSESWTGYSVTYDEAASEGKQSLFILSERLILDKYRRRAYF